MKPRWQILLAFVMSLWILQSAAQGYARIVSLKPNLTEIVFALGEGNHLVGATSYCLRPAAAQKIPRVADYMNADTEKILALKPDLVLASYENSSQREIEFLQARGLKVELFAFSTIAETLNTISKIGEILGKNTEAQEIRHQMEQKIQALRETSQKLPSKKVLFIVGYQPLVVAGGSNFFQEAAQLLHVENVAGASTIKYPTYTTELLIRAAPEVIIDLAMGSETSVMTEEKWKWWQQFDSIPAVKNKQIFPFAIEKMRAAPGLASALRELSVLLRPETKE